MPASPHSACARTCLPAASAPAWHRHVCPQMRQCPQRCWLLRGVPAHTRAFGQNHLRAFSPPCLLYTSPSPRD
eukprot:14053244-Alexandrium_andersonii.AAC.1